jgi:hypothetical protein
MFWLVILGEARHKWESNVKVDVREKWDVKAWSGFSHLRIGSIGILL